MANTPAPTLYKGPDVTAAYKAIYGKLPEMRDKKGILLPQNQNVYPDSTLKTPTGENINVRQLMYMAQKNAAPAGGGATADIDAQIQAKYAQLGLKSPGSVLGASPQQVQGILSQLSAYEKAQTPPPPAAPPAPPADPNAPQPESIALQQMGQIDPTSEALRTAVAGSYLTPLQQAGTPKASDYQSYLDLFKQVDPEEYLQRANMAGHMDSYLRAAQAEAALGSQLDPVTARQVEQQTRLGQAARGNVYGTPQMVQEAMTTGQAGEARKQQRQAALGQALGAQQGYLGAGLGLGDTALSLYNQNQANLRNAQSGALSYLGSGQTPYQAGASYLDRANANAAAAAQGGPVYNPAALGQSYTGSAQQAPQYGLDIGAQTQNWYNSLGAYAGGGGMPVKNKGAAAASGALSGAASGAMAGAPLAGATYGLSIPIGAVVGGALGGAGGYFS
jgi:hypothetical protein